MIDRRQAISGVFAFLVVPLAPFKWFRRSTLLVRTGQTYRMAAGERWERVIVEQDAICYAADGCHVGRLELYGTFTPENPRDFPCECTIGEIWAFSGQMGERVQIPPAVIGLDKPAPVGND